MLTTPAQRDREVFEEELRRIAPDDLTPREALEAVYRLRALLPPG